MSGKWHKINTVANNQNIGIIMRNNPTFDLHDFVPSQNCWSLVHKSAGKTLDDRFANFDFLEEIMWKVLAPPSPGGIIV